MSREQTATSKLLSLVLRHEPGLIGVALDADGWVDVDELLARCNAHGRALSRESLLEIVRTNSKQRFALSADGARIRASQGHSVCVELGYPPAVPPEILFHGTVAAILAAILARGLHKMARHHVHLSADEATARAVGARRGRPVVLRVASGRMHAHGMAFYVSDNGVWLTDAVPPEYLESPG